MNQTIRFCTTADNVRLAYAVSGEGPPLVMSATWLTHLEHQWHSLAWRPWLDAFSRDYKLLRYDSRGCGLSDRDTANLSFETWISDFERVVEAASFRRFSLLGTCQGGPIAIEYAARHPERVSHLVLYSTYARGRLRWTDRPKEVDKARVLLDLTELGWGQENNAFLQVWASAFQPGGTMEHLRSWCDQQRAATSAETAVRLLRIGWNVDVRDAARKIRCPVLIVHPDRDAVVPIDEGRFLASLIPDARFVQLDSENHMPLADEPAWPRLLGELRGFLAQPSAPPPPPPPHATRFRSMSSRRASAPSWKELPKVSTIRRSPHRSGCRRRPFETISPGSSIRFASSTATRPSFAPAKRASEPRNNALPRGEPGQLSLICSPPVDAFGALGSRQRPVLTAICRTRRA